MHHTPIFNNWYAYHNICLMGDFSARISHLQDYFVFENYLTHITCYNCENILQPDIATRSLLLEKCHATLERTVIITYKDYTVKNYGYKIN